MGDAIDERNKREKIARSIIKFWNVNYTLPPEKDESEEILKRIQEEAKADEAAKWAEIDALVEREQRQKEEEALRGGSGSQMDDVTEGQIERILYEGTEENESAGE
ncbi:MAG: hypothetical protein HFI35_09260 [Roseburia sp.]|jgi:hypothetical protein|nr:hypothetical protein [Roseburia sp.]